MYATNEKICERIDEAVEKVLAEIYKEENITSGDIAPDQLFLWEDHIEKLGELFVQLIEQNKEFSK